MGLFDKAKNVVPMKYQPTRRVPKKPFSKKIVGTIKRGIPTKVEKELNKIIGMLPKNPKNIFAKLNKVKKKLAVMKPKKK